MEDFSTGSRHPDCPGDSDICPDRGCKSCQGDMYDNYIRGRYRLGNGTEGVIRRPEYMILSPDRIEREFNL